MPPYMFRPYSMGPLPLSLVAAAHPRAASWWSVGAPSLLKAESAFTLLAACIRVEPRSGAQQRE